MIRYDIKTKVQTTVREPAQTQLSRDNYEEWRTGVIDGVPLDPDDWFIGAVHTQEIIDIIEKDKLTP